ncbi:hypothetical protein LF95_23600 [Thalassospira sp. TSL5-1]|nr:hypothetical protein LF95_23600 [Thalassospira sp. TSL5-1]
MSPVFTGLVLAGGAGTRMGGNKPFRMLGPRPLVDYALSNARRDCPHVLIASNEDPQKYAAWGCPVIADHPHAGLGPLGGILAGLKHLPNGSNWLAVYAVDCPIVPAGLPAILHRAICQLNDNATPATQNRVLAAHARYCGRDHYLASLWHRDMAPAIFALLAQDQRRVRQALMAGNARTIEFPVPDDATMADLLFANINQCEDIARFEKTLPGNLPEKLR